jgi:hypothetical protein
MNMTPKELHQQAMKNVAESFGYQIEHLKPDSDFVAREFMWLALAGVTAAQPWAVDEPRLGQLWHEMGEPLEWPQFLALAQHLAGATAAQPQSRWPIKPLDLVQVVMPDGTHAMLKPCFAYFDAHAMQELENSLKTARQKGGAS